MQDLTRNLVKAQVEYYFSDANLATDRYLISVMMKPEHTGWVGIDDIRKLPAITKLTSSEGIVIAAVKESSFLEYDADRKLCRRPDYELTAEAIKQGVGNRDLRRTVFLYGVPIRYDKNALLHMLKVFGDIKRIHFDNSQEEEGPDKRIGAVICKHKLYQPPPQELKNFVNYPPSVDGAVPWPMVEDDDLENLKCCYVVFTTQSQANKACKAYRHHSAIRALTQYEYRKLEKRVIMAEARGERPSFNSPLTTPKVSIDSTGTPGWAPNAAAADFTPRNTGGSPVTSPKSKRSYTWEDGSRFPKPIHTGPSRGHTATHPNGNTPGSPKSKSQYILRRTPRNVDNGPTMQRRRSGSDPRWSGPPRFSPSWNNMAPQYGGYHVMNPPPGFRMPPGLNIPPGFAPPMQMRHSSPVMVRRGRGYGRGRRGGRGGSPERWSEPHRMPGGRGGGSYIHASAPQQNPWAGLDSRLAGGRRSAPSAQMQNLSISNGQGAQQGSTPY